MLLQNAFGLLLQVDTLKIKDVFNFNFTPISLTDCAIILISIIALLYSVKSFRRIDRIEKPILFEDRTMYPDTYIIELLDGSSGKNLRILDVKCKSTKKIFFNRIKYEYKYNNDVSPPLVEIKIRDISLPDSYNFKIKTNYGFIKYKKEGVYNSKTN